MIQELLTYAIVVWAFYTLIDTFLFIIRTKDKNNEKIRTKRTHKRSNRRVF